MLFNFKDSGVIMPQTVLVTTRRIIAQKPQVIEAYLKGFLEAIAYLLDPVNKKSVMQIIASNLRLDSTGAAEDAYQAVVNSYERIPYPNREGMKMLHGVLGSLNPRLAGVRPETVVDEGPLRQLEKAGFIRGSQKP